MLCRNFGWTLQSLHSFITLRIRTFDIIRDTKSYNFSKAVKGKPERPRAEDLVQSVLEGSGTHPPCLGKKRYTGPPPPRFMFYRVRGFMGFIGLRGFRGFRA